MSIQDLGAEERVWAMDLSVEAKDFTRVRQCEIRHDLTANGCVMGPGWPRWMASSRD